MRGHCLRARAFGFNASAFAGNALRLRVLLSNAEGVRQFQPKVGAGDNLGLVSNLTNRNAESVGYRNTFLPTNPADVV